MPILQDQQKYIESLKSKQSQLQKQIEYMQQEQQRVGSHFYLRKLRHHKSQLVRLNQLLESKQKAYEKRIKSVRSFTPKVTSLNMHPILFSKSEIEQQISLRYVKRIHVRMCHAFPWSMNHGVADFFIRCLKARQHMIKKYDETFFIPIEMEWIDPPLPDLKRVPIQQQTVAGEEGSDVKQDEQPPQQYEWVPQILSPRNLNGQTGLEPSILIEYEDGRKIQIHNATYMSSGNILELMHLKRLKIKRHLYLKGENPYDEEDEDPLNMFQEEGM